MERARGRPRGSRGTRARGGNRRGRKQRVVVSDDEEIIETTKQKEPEPIISNPEDPEKNATMTINDPATKSAPGGDQEKPMEGANEIDGLKDDDQLELENTPTFGSTTMQRNVPQVMLRLNWGHKVNLIGEKVLNTLIYMCDLCEKPILIYGRMIPCKHVFCLACARTEAVLKQCPRCKDRVSRVEQTGLGTVFMCTHAGTRYGSAGCRRTYLSQRDLQAHINHRHVTAPPPSATATQQETTTKLTTDKQQSNATITPIVGQQNSHLRKDLMGQPPSILPHPLNKPFNSSGGYQRMGSNNDNQPQMMGMMNSHTATNNKMPHHSQDMHHNFYNQHNNMNFGAGSSSSASGVPQQPNNNFYQPYSQSYNNNNMGHYSHSPPSSQQQNQQHQNWNQQQYFR